jgi:hypothetical protein
MRERRCSGTQRGLRALERPFQNGQGVRQSSAPRLTEPSRCSVFHPGDASAQPRNVDFEDRARVCRESPAKSGRSARADTPVSTAHKTEGGADGRTRRVDDPVVLTLAVTTKAIGPNSAYADYSGGTP